MVTWHGGAALLGRSDLVWALTISPHPGEAEPFVFGLDRDVLAKLLTPVADQICVPAVNARFRLRDGEITIAAEATEGRELDVASAIQAVAAAVMAGRTGSSFRWSAWNRSSPPPTRERPDSATM